MKPIAVGVIFLGTIFLPSIVFANDLTVHTSVTIGITPPQPATPPQHYISSSARSSTDPTTGVKSKPFIGPVLPPNILPIKQPVVVPANTVPAPAKVTVLPVKNGSRGAAVLVIQQILTRKKMLVVPRGQDGIYGPRTKAAVIAYQKKIRLKQTGDVDAATAAALAKEL